jgi:hypothetical protein
VRARQGRRLAITKGYVVATAADEEEGLTRGCPACRPPKCACGAAMHWCCLEPECAALVADGGDVGEGGAASAALLAALPADASPFALDPATLC